MARNIAEGRGLVSDALWSFATPPLVFPRPAFEVWLPLPSLLAAVPTALFAGPAPIPLLNALRSAQLVTGILGAILAVLAWRLAADVAEERGLPVGRARTLAIGAGLTAAVYLPLVLHAIQPDSTILFGVLVVGICLLATRVLRDPRGARLTDPRLLGIGLLLGLAALTRNEAAWVALAWAWLAWRVPGRPRAERLRLIGIVAALALVVFVPWAVRDWLVFGNPLPGQALSNALSVTGYDIFAWKDPPTLARYIAEGPAALIGMRIDGITHNLVSVLLLLGIPVSAIGLVGLPWQARDRSLRLLVLVERDHVPGDQPVLPRGHDVGHVPPCRGARPGPAGGLGPRRPRRAACVALGDGSAGRARWPGSARCSPSAPRPCSRPSCCPAWPRPRPTPRGPTTFSPASWPPPALRSTARPRSSPTTPSGPPSPRACRRSRCPTSRRRPSRTWRATSVRTS